MIFVGVSRAYRNTRPQGDAMTTITPTTSHSAPAGLPRMNDPAPDFTALNTELLGLSIDSHYGEWTKHGGSSSSLRLVLR